MVSPEELAGPDRARQLFGAEVVDADGAKVGTVTEVFLDDDTDQPKWVSIRTGWFGTNESLVPLQGAQFGDGRIRVQYDKSTIKAAPRSDEGNRCPVTTRDSCIGTTTERHRAAMPGPTTPQPIPALSTAPRMRRAPTATRRRLTTV